MPTPSLPQGTRDFGPETVRKRQYILDTIRSVFVLYGFQPLETPAFELLTTLTGKYGEEGDKLIFKILNNGLDRPEKKAQAEADFAKVLEGKNVPGLTERALRYDLTIPFARYVAMNSGTLTLPFRRYQIQPVWRADRPQRGRYREFTQCDADVVGSRSLLNEAELIGIYREVLQRLGLQGASVRINSRKLLSALAESSGGPERLTDITVAIDKLDKIGLAKVEEELRGRGLEEDAISRIRTYLGIGGGNEEKLQAVAELLGPGAAEGLAELREVLELVHAVDGGRQAVDLSIDLTLARGLNYYTGTILEVKAPPKVAIGSIGGGGRYDDLTGLFGLPGVPGVGISFGVDRMYDVLEELQLFPASVTGGTRVLFLHLGAQEARTAMTLAAALRKAGVSAEVYPENAKIGKQFKYAEKRSIPFAVTIGPEELAGGTCTVKNLETGERRVLEQGDLISALVT